MPLDDNTEAQTEPSAAPPGPPGPHEEPTALIPSTPPADPPVNDATLVHPENAPPPDTGPAAEPTVLTEGPPAPRAPSDASISLGGPTQPQGPPSESYSTKLSKQAPPVPGYEIRELLGRGTYGVVYHAVERDTGIDVAIKFFAHGTGLQWQLLQAEVKQLAMLQSDPGIVQLKDVEPDGRPPYYVMAYADRGCLARRLAKGPVPLPEALAIFRRVTETLAYVHAKGIRHCDLKPGNVLLDARGRARVADFGQAHLSSDVAPALGTFFYMAPEQADLANQIPDARWDVYGLGALLYALLTGQPPRKDARVRDELAKTVELSHRLRRYRAHVEAAPPPRGHRTLSGMDRQLARIIERCLEVDPEKRFRDAGAILDALRTRERQHRQRPLLVFGFAAPLLLMLVMSGLGAWEALHTLDTSRHALERQLQESDLVNACLVASVVEDHLQARTKLLTGGLDIRRCLFQELAGGKPDRVALEQVLVQLMDRAREANKRFAETTVSTHDGRVIALVREGAQGRLDVVPPERRKSQFAQFSWRDWFSGRGDRWDEIDRQHPPIRAPHVSDPYVSSLDGSMFVSVSVPIRDPKDAGAEPVGVLEGAVKIDELNAWLRVVPTANGFPVLLNKRGQYLMHRSERIRPPQRGGPPHFDLDRLRALLGERKRGTFNDYVDPVDGQVYLGGFARLDEPIGWVALVQHDRAVAMQPMDELQGDMILWGVIIFGTAGGVLTGLWATLLWILRRQKQLAPA